MILGWFEGHRTEMLKWWPTDRQTDKHTNRMSTCRLNSSGRKGRVKMKTNFLKCFYLSLAIWQTHPFQLFLSYLDLRNRIHLFLCFCDATIWKSDRDSGDVPRAERELLQRTTENLLQSSLLSYHHSHHHYHLLSRRLLLSNLLVDRVSQHHLYLVIITIIRVAIIVIST